MGLSIQDFHHFSKKLSPAGSKIADKATRFIAESHLGEENLEGPNPYIELLYIS